MLPKVAQIVATAVLYKVIFYKTAQKVIILIGLLMQANFIPRTFKNAQSGHTDDCIR